MMGKDFFDEADEQLIQDEFNSLMNNLVRCNNSGDHEIIRRAFDLANKAHWNMRRRSGEPYIIHPIAVAKIVNQEIGLGVKSIAAALMHDVVEDTDTSVEDIEKLFGPKIASLVEGLTKIAGTYKKGSSTSLQAENFRHMLLTISDDIRVILIKIGDRLHNMRTLASMPDYKQMKIAGETIFLYAPLAQRLGLFAIKSELEDLSFKYRQPQIYNEIASKIALSEKQNSKMIDVFAEPIIQQLAKEGIVFQLTARYKSIFSIWKKMQNKNIPFEEIYDIFAVRIIVDPIPDVSEKTQCWNIFSIITEHYTPKPDRLRDWLSRPKPNGYEALHVTVMGPTGQWVEVQIRSRRMDEIAEFGLAAHWRYKGEKERQDGELDKWIKNVREILGNPLDDPVEFLDEFKLNLFSSEIMVFTPKGRLVNLPKDATAIDFAYEIHTEIGHKAIGAKVNYKLLPINTILNSGDQVEIITSDIAKPQKEWLQIVKTAKAREAIRDFLYNESMGRIHKGMRILEEKLNELNLVPTPDILKKLVSAYNVQNKEELYADIALTLIELDDLKKILNIGGEKTVKTFWGFKLGGGGKNQEKLLSDNSKKDTEEKESENDHVVIDRAAPFLLRENIESARQSYEIAPCCKPIPGDEVMGYLSHDNKIIIHKPDCPHAIRIMSNEGDRVVSVKWTIHKIVSFVVRISITGLDRVGMLRDMSNTISSDLRVNIVGINIQVVSGIFSGTIDVYVHHARDVNNLINRLSAIDGVQNVARVETFTDFDSE